MTGSLSRLRESNKLGVLEEVAFLNFKVQRPMLTRKRNARLNPEKAFKMSEIIALIATRRKKTSCSLDVATQAPEGARPGFVSHRGDVFRLILEMKPPKVIALDPDDYDAKYVGFTSDGRQFFATTPFVPAPGTPGREFDALYIFDSHGNLIEAQIDDLGTRAELETNIESARQLRQRKLAGLGQIVFRRIQIKPFSLERFGVTFGFIPCPPEENPLDDEEQDEMNAIGWRVDVEPGNFMSFTEPWNSGEYDT